MFLDLAFLGVVLALIFAIYRLRRTRPDASETEQPDWEGEGQTNKQQQPAPPNEQPPPNPINRNHHEQRQQDSDEEKNEDDQVPEEKLTRAQLLHRERRKREKKERKEARQYLEEQKKKQEAEDDEARQKALQEEEVRRKKEEECYQKLVQEEAKKKEEEFNNWKHLFSVSGQGKNKSSAEEEAAAKQKLDAEIIECIRKEKLVMLEDLKHKFKVGSTQEVVDMIKVYESQGRLNGVFDERGKYLFVTTEEWDAVRNLMSARGRIKKTDMMVECARLIKIPQKSNEQAQRSLDAILLEA